MSEPAAFDFRPLTAEDLPMLRRWFAAPHARRSFGDRLADADVLGEYLAMIAGRSPSKAFIVMLGGRPVGMMEWERMGDSPDFQRAYEVEDPDTANCDVLLGEPDAAHRGLGAGMIRAFLERIVFADPRIHAVVIDPMTDNFIAIRAYEKAGFRFLRALPEDGEGYSVYLMELRREELSGSGRQRPEQKVYIRPARSGELAIAEAIDDDACRIYEEAGIVMDPTRVPSFFAREAERWAESLGGGRMLFACAPGGEPVGFAAFGFVDGRPYLQQVSVRRAWMGRGIGRSLVERALRWSVRAGELWLTTYDHLPYNRPFYETLGFSAVAGDAVGPELGAILEEERRALPAPEHRIAMCYRRR
jgi:RimJ/RimL family protein N-acetyltransferase